MARAGKEEYKKYLERIDGDMRLTYSVVPQKTMSARQRFTYLYDAEYLLFYKKDGEEYVKSMDAYLKNWERMPVPLIMEWLPSKFILLPGEKCLKALF